MATLVLNQKRTSIWGILAVAASAATALAVFSYLSYIREQIPVSGKLVPMVVAGGDVEPGTTLTSEMLDLKDHPSRYLPEQALTAKGQALGHVVTVPILKGEPVTTRKFGRTGGPSTLVPGGLRAYSLAIASGAGLGFTPQPGDRVDVLAFLPQEALGESTAVTVLTSKQVASVGTPMGQTGKVDERLGVNQPARPNLSVTLFITPLEAERLAMAEAMGKITIVLAPDGAENGPAPAPVTAKDIAA